MMDQRALLFTDIVDSTKVVQRLGDSAAAALWAEHDRLARALLAEHGGLEIDRSDGFFLLFGDVGGAARFAVRYHAAVAGLELVARIGIHHGAVTLRQNPPEAVARGAKPLEAEGLAKPLAARVMGLAAGGQTLVTGDAATALQVHLPPSLRLHAHGYYRLKGIEDPLPLFELGDERCGFVPPADVDKAYRVVRDGELWRPVREIRHNLAPERDTFVGRVAELRESAAKFESGARLVSVLGVGGTGKTRLVRRYAAAWLGDWPGGVYFCDLSEARSLEGICFAVASALEVPLGKDDPVVQLGHAIAGRGRCLVILDNFEQVVEHAAGTLGCWLDRARDAAFVVTSRERLQLAGEDVLAVEPLPTDDEAIELFAIRARAQRAGFALDGSNRAAVHEIVKLLDGLPLAIELAAARVRVLSPVQIVERLRDRFVLLVGAQGAASRQATLKAAIDWSWELLDPWEQAALAQCSVFEGGFTLEAAEQVLDLSKWAEAPPVIDVVQALVDKSLVRSWLSKAGRRHDIAEPYFGMYLSIHEYASQCLVASGPAAAERAHRAHGVFFARLGSDENQDALFRHGGIERRSAAVRELQNLVLACRRAIPACDAATAVPCYVAAWQILELRGPLSLGLELGTQLLAMPGLSPLQRAIVLNARATAAWRTGKLDEAQSLLEAGLEAARGAGDARREAAALGHIGTVCMLSGRLTEALQHYGEALRLYRMSSNRGREAWALGASAIVNDTLGHVVLAEQQYEAAIAISREIGDRASEGSLLANLASLLRQQGQLERAHRLVTQALELIRESGTRRDETMALNTLGCSAEEQGRFDDARRYFEQALSCAREVGVRQHEGMVLVNLANLSGLLGQHSEARQQYEHALAVQREVGDLRTAGVTIAHLGHLAMIQDRLGEAQTLLDEALAILRTQSRRYEGFALRLLAELHFRRGDAPAARNLIEASEAALREVRDTIDLARLACLRGRLAVASGDADAARRALEQAESIADALSARVDSALGREVAALRSALS